MVRSDKGQIEVSGNPVELLADVSTILMYLKDTFVSDWMSVKDFNEIMVFIAKEVVVYKVENGRKQRWQE